MIPKILVSEHVPVRLYVGDVYYDQVLQVWMRLTEDGPVPATVEETTRARKGKP